jgi:hypothetical protein
VAGSQAWAAACWLAACATTSHVLHKLYALCVLRHVLSYLQAPAALQSMAGLLHSMEPLLCACSHAYSAV